MGLPVQGFGCKHRFALRLGQGLKSNFETKAPQGRLVNLIKQIGGTNKDALVALHTLQHFIDFTDFVLTLRAATIL